jgi:dTDP-4-amino-4,6-dideoxygalactose transaminase
MSRLIPFNKAPYTGAEDKYVIQAMRKAKMSGDGEYTRLCQEWFEKDIHSPKVLLTTSGTSALEMAALLIDTKPGDEVIMPSYTFVSTANAFVLRGARIVFVDIRPDTMNIDETKIEAAITKKTKAIIPVHYAGVSCEMDSIIEIGRHYGLAIIEDAAQGVMSEYKGRKLGAIGRFGAYSFHDTKNITSGGEGGALVVNDESYITKAEIVREKGTNRSQFYRGMVDKYGWVDIGSSYLQSEIQAAYLYGQLEKAEEIFTIRKNIWDFYFDDLCELEEKGYLKRPTIPAGCMHNAHMFYIKLKSESVRSRLIEYLKIKGIIAVFHYVPLHTSIAGKLYSRFNGEDIYTTCESERLLRLPLYWGLSRDDVDYVVENIRSFFSENNE